MPPKIDLKGQRFGRLVVLEEAGRRRGYVTWLCKCDCGNEKIIRGPELRLGDAKSCGCFHKEISSQLQTKHGLEGTSSYLAWTNMIARCYNPNNQAYHNYGGRGIRVCDRWLGENGFQNFYEDIGKYRKEGTTLDRINNDGDYEPSNCRWATWQQQAQNMRAKGYYWCSRRNKWKAQISVNYKRIHLGFFDKEENARQAYLEAKEKYHN